MPRSRADSQRIVVVRCSPLFLALIARTAPPDVLLALVRAFPEATRRVPSGGCGNLPLHAAVTFSATTSPTPTTTSSQPMSFGASSSLSLSRSTTTSFMVMRTILRAYPEAARRFNHRGWLPLHLACSAKPPAILLHFVNVPYMQPPFRPASSVDAALLDDLVSMVRLLLETHPQAAAQATTGMMNHGWLPLHCAVRTGFFEVLDLLLQHYPPAARIPAGAGAGSASLSSSSSSSSSSSFRVGSLPFHMMFFNESALVSGTTTTTTSSSTTTTTTTSSTTGARSSFATRRQGRRGSGLVATTTQLLRNAAPLLRAYPQAIFMADPRHGISPAETARKRDLFVFVRLMQAAFPSLRVEEQAEAEAEQEDFFLLATETALPALFAACQHETSNQVILSIVHLMETRAFGTSIGRRDCCRNGTDLEASTKEEEEDGLLLPLHLACRRLAGWDGRPMPDTPPLPDTKEPEPFLSSLSTDEMAPPALSLAPTSSLLSNTTTTIVLSEPRVPLVNQEIVLVMVQRYPAALLVPDGDFQLLPFVMLCLSPPAAAVAAASKNQTAAAACNVPLDLLYQMLREYPECLRTR